MHLLAGLLGGLIGGGFALSGQYVAHRYSTKRSQADHLRSDAAVFLAQSQNIQSVLRTVYADPKGELNTARLDAAQVPYRQSEISLRWTLESLKVSTKGLDEVEAAWNKLGARWHLADGPEWQRLNDEFAMAGSSLDATVKVQIEALTSGRLWRRR